MRKHGSNRPSIAVVAAMSALLVASLAGTSFAGSSGSKSGQGSAVWLVNQTEAGCADGSVNTSDNLITDDSWWPGVWVKSSDSRINIYSLTYKLYDKGNNEVGSGNLSNSGLIAVDCGLVFHGFELSGGFPGPLGSLTLKVFTSDGKAFGNDSARFA